MNTAIYLRDPHPRDTRTPPRSGQEAACRSYCRDNGMTPAAVYADPPGGREQLERLIAAATSRDSPTGPPYPGRAASSPPPSRRPSSSGTCCVSTACA